MAVEVASEPKIDTHMADHASSGHGNSVSLKSSSGFGHGFGQLRSTSNSGHFASEPKIDTHMADHASSGHGNSVSLKSSSGFGHGFGQLRSTANSGHFASEPKIDTHMADHASSGHGNSVSLKSSSGFGHGFGQSWSTANSGHFASEPKIDTHMADHASSGHGNAVSLKGSSGFGHGFGQSWSTSNSGHFASEPKIDTHMTDHASFGHGNSMSLKSSNGFGHGFGQSLSTANGGNFEFGTVHFDGTQHSHDFRCAKCSCLPGDCVCFESHQVGPAYCPNPNETDLPREFETHVQVFMRVPEMQEVEETHYRKDLSFEKRKVSVMQSVLTYDEVEQFEMVPVMRLVTKTRPEIFYHVTEEEIEITVFEQQVEYEDVCVIRKKAKVITEEVDETIQVPVVKEVKVTRMCEEWTGGYCESEVEKFCSPGDFNLICEDSCHQHSSGHHHIRKSRSMASSLSGDDSPSHRHSGSKPKRSQSLVEKDSNRSKNIQ